jgi:hypothetical protein
MGLAEKVVIITGPDVGQNHQGAGRKTSGWFLKHFKKLNADYLP